MKIAKITWYRNIWRSLRRYDDNIRLEVHVDCTRDEIDILNKLDLQNIFTKITCGED